MLRFCSAALWECFWNPNSRSGSPAVQKLCSYLLLHEAPLHKLVICMLWPLATPSQTEQALIVEITLLPATSEFTSHQFKCPMCYGCSPLFPKLAPQLTKLSLLHPWYLQLLEQVTMTLVTLPASWPPFQHQWAAHVSVIHTLLHH